LKAWTIATRLLTVRARSHPALRAAAGIALVLGLTPLWIAGAPSANAAALAPTWSTSSNTASATAVTYTYTFTTSSTSAVSSVTMTVPTATGGAPAVGTVTPSNFSGGTVGLASGVLTYSRSSTSLNSGTPVSIQITGITNTPTAGNYTSTVTTKNGGTVVDSGVSGSVTFTAGALISPVWSTTSTTDGAGGVTYSYGLTTGTTSPLSAVSMTVPPGTGGSPTVGSVTPSSVATGGAVVLSGSVLTYTFTSTAVSSGTPVSITINGLSNTGTAGSYTSSIVSKNGTLGVDSGTTPAIIFTAGTLSSPSLSASTTTVSATGVSYTYDFTTGTVGSLSTVRMTLPPGTTGSAAVGIVTPASVANGGAVALVNGVLTYTFTGTSLNPGTVVSVQINGLINTPTAGTYKTMTTTENGSTPVDSGVNPALTITLTGLLSPTWSASATSTGASASYTYALTTTSTSSLSSVSMTVPPGTGGSPTVGSVTPSTVSGGSVASSSGTLTYTFSATAVSAGTAISIQVNGLANTGTAGRYLSEIITENGGSAVDSGATPAVTITSTALSSPVWTTTTAIGSAAASYTYTFSVGSTSSVSSVTMAVPPGTTGAPTVGAVSPSNISGGSVARSGALLTYSFGASSLNSGQAVSIQINGLINTPTAGRYSSALITYNGASAVDSGVTPAVTIFAGTLFAPAWSTSSTVTSSTNVSYMYNFTTATTSTLSSVTMTVPSGTAGSPTVGTVTPSSMATGTSVVLVAGILTYSFTAAQIPGGTAVSIQIKGLTNTGTAGTYTSTVSTLNGSASVDTGVTASVAINTGGSLTAASWSTSKSTAGATGASYVYAFTAATSATNIRTVTMTVPAGTAGTASLGTVTPAGMTGGTISLSGGVLTYSFTANHTLDSGTAVSIQINGLTNTATPGSYPSEIVTKNSGAAVDSGFTPAVTITPGVLVSPTWSSSSTTAGATGVSYAYTFTTASTSSLSSVTMTVPAGTAGSPTVGTVAPAAMATAGTISLSGGLLTFSFTATAISAGQAVSIQINGLTNTATGGSYSSTLTTRSGSLSVDSGATPSLTISTGTLSLTAPASFAWTILLSGALQSVVDLRPADQQFTVNDGTGSGAGWNIMVSATTFTNGANTLSNSGTFIANGSLTSPTAINAPTATCVTSCTLPTNSVSGYPVAITTAASSPTPVKVYGAMAGTGLGAIVIGGSTATNPLGWWLTVPATALSGTYTSTVTVSVASGP